MSVQRYEVTLNHADSDDPEAVMTRQAFGAYVKHRDYAALEARCAALAAENAGLKAANEEGCRWDGEQWVGLSNETPAADAFLAEVRASGVEMFADDLLCPDLDSTIREFAAQLRKGGA